MKPKYSWKPLVFSFVAILALAVAIVFLNWYSDHRRSNFEGESDLYVYPGTSVEEVVSRLKDSCNVLRPRSIDRVFESVDSIAPGHYTISSGLSSIYVSRMVSRGWQTPVRLVLSGTMRTQEGIARKISSQMMLDSLDVIISLRDPELLGRYGFTPEDVFGLIMPDTYEVWWTDGMEQLLDKQKEAYDAFWTEERLSKAKSLGLTRKEVSVLASIVSGETNYEPEMPSIAGVYLNRLRLGMKLQADPTVAFLLDYKVNRILNRHLQIDSPYNTYMYAGLPPAPIAVPSKACLNAVLNPDRHGYLYFCASPDFNGTHRFASSYSEHLRNAREFQSALNKRSK